MVTTRAAATGIARSLAVGLLLAGQAKGVEPKPFDLVRGARIQGVVVTPQIGFKLETAKSSLIGFGMSGRAGEEVLQKFGVPDPAFRLREQFLASLGKGHAGEVQVTPDAREDDAADSYAKAFGQGFVLDFRTRIWRLMYSAGKKHHRYEYWGRARLVRLADAKVVWNETCKFLGDVQKTEGGEEDMLANDAALLKATMNMAVDHCLTELKQRFGAP